LGIVPVFFAGDWIGKMISMPATLFFKRHLRFKGSLFASKLRLLNQG